ncbi:MAG: 30S ribosomal protein S17 [Candidatus Moranbacteria bacterium CG_4_9_14_3_um_filter_40_7]|nr:MAG: 30S ribosomal protein S17 [Candidatus Moranbacteria bacterium CG23_combo_of_CG06-09_8_20_14_all_40_16]PIU80703.1 MAG: 30S ribosomal protein S17 [Candidatus Moranbacteria bacterium CG06_land_8_20_14_3_00_40_12]PJA88171.1 MAG: 30S ribosomal protein S17 [Candidatus Moranbacteria bacterium CG_4_9_14_3_um_filter_40_7]
MEKSIGKNKILLRKKGEVVGDKMDKTIAVSVVSFETHPKYKKKYKVIKRYKAHDPENKFKAGEKVEIIPCRPISKEKKFKVVY